MRKFVKVPKMWQVRLAETRAEGRTYRVALFLLDQASFSHSAPPACTGSASVGTGNAAHCKSCGALG
jgi:hypothetical protein